MPNRDNQSMQVRDAIAGSTDAVIASVASKWGMTGGVGVSLYGWLSSGTTAVFVGVIVTVVGFIINLIFQRRRETREIKEYASRLAREVSEERRAEELHRARMEALKNGTANVE